MIRIFRGKVPFQWLDLPENLQIETGPRHLAVHQEFNKPTTRENITRNVATILFLAMAVKFVSDAVRYEASELSALLPSGFHLLPLVAASVFVWLAIMLNVRRRLKRIIFDFNTGTVNLQARHLSFIGAISAEFSTPFSILVKPNTREKQHHSSDEYSSHSWTTDHEGYEVMVHLKKRGHQPILFLETDDINEDYGELFGALARVAGIDDPLLEMAPFWESDDD